MNITLNADAEEIIREKLKTGRFTTPDEVVLAGLQALAEHDVDLGELRSKVAAGLDAARRGDLSDGEEFFSHLEREEDASSNHNRRTA